MTHKTPTYARPGKPEAPGWKVLAYFASLFGAAVIGWALLAGFVWLAWVYTLVVASVVVALAAVVFIVCLALKRPWLSKFAAGVLFAGLVLLVLWVVSL